MDRHTNITYERQFTNMVDINTEHRYRFDKDLVSSLSSQFKFLDKFPHPKMC